MSFKSPLFFLLSTLAVAFALEIPFFHSAKFKEAIKDVEKHIADFNATYNLPSLVVGVSVKGKTEWTKTLGSLELENHVPATRDAPYRLASISKTFLGGILAELVDQGLLNYDDELSKHLSEEIYPKKEWNITLRELISHTAGERVAGVKDFYLPVELPKNVTESIAQFKDEPLQYKPGTQFAYSNNGMRLVGAVIESITKLSYPKVVAQFCGRLGLNSTFAETVDMIIPHRPRYYGMPNMNDKTGNVPTELYDQLASATAGWPAGGLVSTVDDLLKWGNLMIDSAKGRKDGFLRPQTVTEMWTPQTLGIHIPLPDTNYGLGWALTRRNLTRHPDLHHPNFMWHAGGLNGLSAVLMVYPQEEVVGVALTNKGGLMMNTLVEWIVERMVE